MTTVPKALKFLRPSINDLVTYFYSNPIKELADIISMLGTTLMRPSVVDAVKAAKLADDEESKSKDINEVVTIEESNIVEYYSLQFKLYGNYEDVLSWGQEYTKNIASEIIYVFNLMREKETDELDFGINEEKKINKKVIQNIAIDISNHYFKTNNEIECVDLLFETDQLEHILNIVDCTDYKRIVKYIIALSHYKILETDINQTLSVARDIYLKANDLVSAFVLAVRMNDKIKIQEIISICDHTVLKQIALLSNKINATIHWEDIDEEIIQLANGEKLNEYFLLLAKELDVLEPKCPEDVYKTYLDENKSIMSVDTAKQKLAAAIVNGFINCGFGTDKYIANDENVILGGKQDVLMTSTASLGLINLWNVNEGLGNIDKYQWCADIHVKAGAYMAFGLCSTNINSEFDPIVAMLNEYLTSTTTQDKIGALLAIGFACVNQQRNDLFETISDIVMDNNNTIEISAIAALTLGLIFCGSCDERLSEIIIQTLLERSLPIVEEKKDDSMEFIYAQYYSVALGLVYLARRSCCDATLVALEAVPNPLGSHAVITVEGMAYACTGNVLQIQKMLSMCCTNTDEEKRNDAISVFNLALIALGEPTGETMLIRLLNKILQYGNIRLKRGVPIALALQSLSNPKPNVVDTLSKLSHDIDADTALISTLALGLVGAGTNNSRIAHLLRQLAAYYCKDATALLAVRISQGLLYMGKGLLSLNPLHVDGLIVNYAALGSITVLLHLMLNSKKLLLNKHHYLFYIITPAITPKMLITVDEDMKLLPVQVRVGQIVDVVGMGGNRREITGFQTHTTPVIINVNEKAELAVEDYISLSPFLEGIVILKKVNLNAS